MCFNSSIVYQDISIAGRCFNSILVQFEAPLAVDSKTYIDQFQFHLGTIARSEYQRTGVTYFYDPLLKL